MAYNRKPFGLVEYRQLRQVQRSALANKKLLAMGFIKKYNGSGDRDCGQTAISLGFQAELIHCEENRYGFKFISENLETLTHLRKLIELNTGDAEATRSELSAWLCD